MVAAAIATGGALAVVGRAVAQQQNFDTVQIDTVKVRDNVYMLVGAGGNTTVFTGDEGILVVDTQFAPLSTKILTAIRAISQGPIRYVVSTHMHGDHIGGNEAISKAGRTRAGGNVVGDLGAGATGQAVILAHENVLNRLSAPPAAGQQAVPFALWPTETFFGKKREFLFNGEAVQIIHEPKAHTDGDSLVFFRKSDVVATGDSRRIGCTPFIDASPTAARSPADRRAQRDSRHHGAGATSTRAARWSFRHGRAVRRAGRDRNTGTWRRSSATTHQAREARHDADQVKAKKRRSISIALRHRHRVLDHLDVHRASTRRWWP
jgi:glyoxylase-like metal-dependent hydrolase (beta-lactamase superfamily II)